MCGIEVKFVSQMLKTDVIAVKFDGNYVLAGIGGFLNIYSISGKLLLNVEIFQGQKIHGISHRHGENIAIFGGVKVALISLQYSSGKVSISKPIIWHNNDWILYLQWIEDYKIALVTAHNELSLWDSKTLTRLKTASCSEKCIIYSALLVGSTWPDLVVMAGTVFQEVIIWMADGKNEDVVDRPVLHRLQGHKGVIFSISYDPSSHRLSSTSDDRSVRVWAVKGGEWRDAHITPTLTLFGHQARVWRSAAVGGLVVSVGEDSRLCVWGDGGRLLARWETHQGGRVWGLDCSLSHNLIVTGGGDGGINLWPLRSWAEVSLTPVALPFPNKLVPRRIRLANNGVTVTVTDSGCILCQTVGGNEWNIVEQNDRLASYSILEVSPCKQFVALATLDGCVLVYRVEYNREPCTLIKVVEVEAMEGKVFSLQWVTSEVIAICGSSGRLDVWGFDATLKQIERKHELSLPRSRESWVSAAILFGDGLVCGDRAGSVHAYRLTDRDSRAGPCASFGRLHGRLGVCSLAVHGDRLVSTGRDGTVRQFELLHGLPDHVSTDNVPMDWVADTVEASCGLLVLGFCEVNFVVWSWKERRSILKIECGGGHRSWDFSLDAENNFHFVFVKDKMVHSVLCPLDKLVKPVLQDGFHTKESGCLCLLPSGEEGRPLIVSGSEDTTIRLSTLDSTGRLKTAVILRSHISSVRALTSFPLEGASGTLLFSAGGRANIRAWRVTTDVKCRQLGSYMLRAQDKRPWRVSQAAPVVDPETRYMDLCAFRFPNDTRVMVLAGCSDGILRLLSCDPFDGKLLLEIEYPDYHTRCILKVSYFPLQWSVQVMLSMATDGTMAFWAISESIVEEIKREETNSLKHLKPFGSLKIHQSGINSFDWIELEPNTFLLATGGDDNALVLTVLRVKLDSQMGVQTVGQRKIESLHSAQVTGLKFADDCLVSVCIDQRVRVWTWNYENKALDCSLVGEYCTTVADVQGLQLLQNRNSISAYVYGKGLEVIEIELRKKETVGK